MSQFPGDEGSKILASGYKYNPFGNIVATNDPRFNQKKPDPTNPVSEVEALTGTRMTKGQKWAAVIGITLALYGVTIYLNKK